MVTSQVEFDRVVRARMSLARRSDWDPCSHCGVSKNGIELTG